MSAAAAERAHLAAIGCDLMASNSARGMVAPPARDWADLAAVPEWLRLPAEGRRRLALRVGLLAMADALTQSIDGEWLGALAEQAGEDGLDWAMAQAGEELPAVPRVEADALEDTGLAILAASLPLSLRAFVSTGTQADLPHDAARLLVERAL